MTILSQILNGSLGKDVRDTLNNLLTKLSDGSLRGPKGDQGIQGVKGDTGPAPSPLSTIATRTADYTLVEADSSTIIRVNSTSAKTVTLPANLPVGFQVLIVQSNTGAVTVSPASGATLISRQGFTKTAGQYAAISLVVTENAGGTAAKYLLAGDGVL